MTKAMAAAFVLILSSALAQRPAPAPPANDLVELDVVALDRDDRAVTDLRQEEFRIKEDGRAVDLKTFAQVTALGSTQPDDGRVVVLLMDDIGVPIARSIKHCQIGVGLQVVREGAQFVTEFGLGLSGAIETGQRVAEIEVEIGQRAT